MTKSFIARVQTSFLSSLSLLLLVAASPTLAQTPLKWSPGPASNPDYDIGGNPSAPHGSGGEGYLRSTTPAPKNFGNLGTSITPELYAGKRVRLSGFVRTESVEKQALLWMRVDGPYGDVLAMDNMQDRPIKGTTGWRQYGLVLDVPAGSARIVFGLLLEGTGRAWMDGVTLEIVGTDVPSTAQPLWDPTGANPEDYEMGGNPLATHGDAGAGYIRSKVAEPRTFGAMATGVPVERLRGQRLKFSAWIRSEDVERSAGLWMRVDGPAGTLEFDNMSSRPITGTTPWTKHDVVLDVPSSAAAITYGILLNGRGKAWIDGVTLATVGTDVPATKILNPYLEYYAGNFATAAKLLPERIARTPASFTLRLVHFLSLHRSGQASEARAYLNEVAGGLVDQAWAAPVVLFYAGRLSEADLLKAAADPDPTIDKQRKCEAYYYLGIAYLVNVGNVMGNDASRTAKAREYLEKSVATGVTTFVEYRAAEAELKRMKK